MQVGTFRQTFYRGELVTMGLARQHEAGSHWKPIKQNRACAAYAMLTTYMGAGEKQLVPDEITE